MQEIFGLSMTTLALVLLGLFIAVVTLVGVMAWRNRIMLKLGLRNIPKRPAQTALIIFGLMLSTVIITSAFGTGDTIAYTIRSLGARTLGETDEIVSASDPAMPGGQRYFEYSRFDELRQQLLDYDRVDGLLHASTWARRWSISPPRTTFPVSPSSLRGRNTTLTSRNSRMSEEDW